MPQTLKNWISSFCRDAVNLAYIILAGDAFLGLSAGSKGDDMLNGHFRNLNWRYCTYHIYGLYKAYVREYPYQIWPYIVQWYSISPFYNHEIPIETMISREISQNHVSILLSPMLIA